MPRVSSPRRRASASAARMLAELPLVELRRFPQHRVADRFHDRLEGLLLGADERIEEGGGADVTPLLPVLEEEVLRLPEHVVEHLNDLLADEPILAGNGEGVVAGG